MRFTVNGVEYEKAVIFLRYAGAQRIIPAPVTFESAISKAKDVFQMELNEDDCIELETDDIPGCGMGIIEPEAWEILLPCLKQVEVKVAKRKANAKQTLVAANVAGPSKAITTSQKPQGSVSFQGVQGIELADIKPIITAEKQPHRAQTVSKPLTAGNAKPKVPAVASQTRLASSSRESAHAGPSASKKVQKMPAPPPPVVQQQEVDELMEEDEEEIEEIPPPKSPRKAKRQRVDSDVEITEIQILNESMSKRRRHSEDVEAENDEVLEVEQPASRQPEVVKPVNGHTTPVLSPKKEPFSNAARQAFAASTVNNKTTSGGSTPSRSYDPTASFVVHIAYDSGDEENSSPFKTKNRHAVRKVLNVACATLEIPEEDRDRANLHIYDERSEQYTLCPRDRTIGECGITESTQLYILLDDEAED